MNRRNRYYSVENYYYYYPQREYTSPIYVVSQPYYSPAYSGYDPYYGGYGRNYYPVVNYGDHYDYDDDDNYGYDDAYYDDDNYYDDGFGGGDWKNVLLRTMLSFVLGSSGDSFYAADPYYAYSGQTPVYAPGGYYTSQPAWIYSPTTYDATPYSDTPYSSMIYADPYTREITREALASGYSQGFIDGQNAASYGYNDYASPYAYAPTVYTGYSTSLAERQQYLNEGYELGYRDALENRDSYGVYDGGGNLDLVSALLGSLIAS